MDGKQTCGRKEIKAMREETICLRPVPPYDFAKTMRRLKEGRDGLCRFVDDELHRTIRVNGKVYLIKVRSLGVPEDPCLQVKIAGMADRGELLAVQTHLQKMFSTTVDLQPFYRHLEQDPALAPLAGELRGLHLVLESDLFECMVKTIIGQQLNLSFAAALNRRLIEYASEPFIAGEESYPVFPSPEQVARLRYDELRRLQFSQRKAEYVIDFARLVTDGKLDLQGLAEKSDQEIIETLTKVRGIGRWSVECFLLFGLGRPDLLPAADIGLRNGVQNVYRLPERPNEEEVRRLGASWSPWSSYATYYIWESLNQTNRE